MSASANAAPTETLVPPHIRRAIDRAVRNALGHVKAEGPLLEVTFPSAAYRLDVAHGLGVVPTGYKVLFLQGGNIKAVDVAQWTDQVAYLESDADLTRARLYFVLTDEVTRVS